MVKTLKTQPNKIINLPLDHDSRTIVHELGHATAYSIYSSMRLLHIKNYMPDPITEAGLDSYLSPKRGTTDSQIFTEKSLLVHSIGIVSVIYRLLNTAEVWRASSWWGTPEEMAPEEQLAELGALYFIINSLTKAAKPPVIDAINRFMPSQNGLSVVDFFEQQILPGYIQANINKKFEVIVKPIVDKLVSPLSTQAQFEAKRIVTAQLLKHGHPTLLNFMEASLASSAFYSKFLSSSVLQNPEMKSTYDMTKAASGALQTYISEIIDEIRKSDEYKAFLIKNAYSLDNGSHQLNDLPVDKLEALTSPIAQMAYKNCALRMDDLKDFDTEKIKALISLDAQYLYTNKLKAFDDLKNFDALKIQVLISLSTGAEEMIAKKATDLLPKIVDQGDLEMLKELMQLGADKQIALTTASAYCKIDIIKLLIQEFGADLNKQDQNGNTVLSSIFFSKGLDTAKQLATELEIDLNQQFYGKWNLLTWLASKGRIDDIKTMVAFGANINGIDGYENTVLTKVSLKDSEAVKELIALGADLNQDIEEYTVLTKFAARWDVRKTIALIKLGADINKVNGRGESALSIFVSDNRLDSVNQLIAVGTELNKPIIFGRALMLAKTPEMAETLIKAGACLTEEALSSQSLNMPAVQLKEIYAKVKTTQTELSDLGQKAFAHHCEINEVNNNAWEDFQSSCKQDPLLNTQKVIGECKIETHPQ